MATQRKLSDYGIRVGALPSGARGAIADVPGVRVGHCTLDDARHKTGVTLLLPTAPGDNVFLQKCAASAVVLNGYGKTCGLVQMEELGTLETPIALTNTLNVGAVHDAMVDVMTRENPLLRSVNPVVAECNDGGCNDIRVRAVQREHVLAALAAAAPDFAEGDVGAGKGMTCHGLKGGIGSASRVLRFAGCAQDYVLGVLVLANHGCLSDLCIAGDAVGPRIAARLAAQAALDRQDAQRAPKAVAAPDTECDTGSCIIVMATDLPLDARQLKRVLRRAGVGLARVGSHLGHGSGDIAIGFSTANRMPQDDAPVLLTHTVLNEALLDTPFRAMAEATEEAVLRALLCADAVTGADGNRIAALTEFWPA